MDKVLKIVFVILIMVFIGVAIYFLLTNQDVSKNETAINESQNTMIIGNNVKNEVVSNDNEYPKFRGIVEEFDGDLMIVSTLDENDTRKLLGDKVYINLGKDNDMLYFEGEEVLITYTGNVRETYPVQIDVVSIEVEYEYKTRIEDLPQEYKLEEAKNDNCIINVHGKEIYNKSELDRFVKNVNNNVPDFIRVIEYTIEGDMIITDVRFEGDNSFRVCIDSTRDKFATEADRTYKNYRYSDFKIEENAESKMYYLENPIEGNLYEMYILGFEENVEVIE